MVVNAERQALWRSWQRPTPYRLGRSLGSTVERTDSSLRWRSGGLASWGFSSLFCVFLFGWGSGFFLGAQGRGMSVRSSAFPGHKSGRLRVLAEMAGHSLQQSTVPPPAQQRHPWFTHRVWGRKKRTTAEPPYDGAETVVIRQPSQVNILRARLTAARQRSLRMQRSGVAGCPTGSSRTRARIDRPSASQTRRPQSTPPQVRPNYVMQSAWVAQQTSGSPRDAFQKPRLGPAMAVGTGDGNARSLNV